MRTVVRFTLLAVCFQLLSGSAAQAQPRDYPWCAWYDRDSYNCGFATLRQCLATVSGAGGICRRNVRSFDYDEGPHRPYRGYR